MVERIYKLKNKMILRINGRKMLIYHKAVVSEYIKYMWFDKTAITYIFSLNILIKEYRVTYNSLDQIFIAHRKKQQFQHAL